MSDVAQDLLTAIEARESEENAKTKEIAWHACPTCGERASRYEIVEVNLDDAMQHKVKLLPCGDVVVWNQIQRVPDSISIADPEVLNWCALHREIVKLHKRCGHNAGCAVCDGDDYVSGTPVYPCATLRIVARGYGLEVEA